MSSGNFPKATPEMLAMFDTPAMREIRRAHDLGRDAGLAGEPIPQGANEDAYRRASRERRGYAGEVIVVATPGCRCTACHSQNWGYRVGCNCPDGGPMEYGALVIPGPLYPQKLLRFMSHRELLSEQGKGVPVINHDTGEPEIIEYGQGE